MMKKTELLALSLGIAGMMAAADMARAQGAPCGMRPQVLDYLSEQYGEVRQSMGLLRDNRVVEVFHSPETGSWSILVTTPAGQTCLIASGQHWEEEAPLAAAARPGDEDA